MAEKASLLDRLFGFAPKNSDAGVEDTVAKNQQFVTPTEDDGASILSTHTTGAGFYGTFVDFDATAKSESELIARYRETAGYPDVDTAIEHIVTDAIASTDDEDPIKLNMDDLEVSDKVKNQIEESFDEVLVLLGFKEKAHDIFRRWYIDGRIYYQKIVDPNQAKYGITELRYIDPRKIKKVRNLKKKTLENGIEIVDKIEEYYVYSEKGLQVGKPTRVPNNSAVQGIKINPDAIAYAPSGLIDLDANLVLSYLHKAIKPVNQLKMMEDAMVINRMARAPERRLFYIDTGNLPKLKSEQYVKDVQDKYKNKIVYDSKTGEIRDDRKFMSMLEDYWIPRREGGRGTEIDTLPGASNLDQTGDIEYLQNKVMQSLNVPQSRLRPDQTVVFGRTSELTRDELIFAKFVARLRTKFNVLFDDLLCTQLMLKGIITTKEEWQEELRPHIKYEYIKDHYLVESKEANLLQGRLEQLQMAAGFVGVYFSREWVQRNIMRMTDDDIKEETDRMTKEPPPVLPAEQGAPVEMDPDSK